MCGQGVNGFLQNAISSSSDPIANPNAYKPGGTSAEDINVITSKANPIIGAIVTVGVVVSVITMCILGIKYMVGSVEERAEYKKSMIPYLVGAVLLFAGSVVVSIIANLVTNIKM